MSAHSWEQFQEELLKRRAEIQELKQLGHTTDLNSESDATGDIVDKSEEVEAAYARDRMSEHLTQELRRIDLALNRIQTGEFGECEGCGDEIPLKRLRARPDATFCLPCQEVADRESLKRSRRGGVDAGSELAEA